MDRSFGKGMRGHRIPGFRVGMVSVPTGYYASKQGVEGKSALNCGRRPDNFRIRRFNDVPEEPQIDES
ncbi:MAG: hypothetical protein A2269_00780 [Lentisphaerae bacterium RIFOXYA12_FULL_60_10]|nr:MAG: hypothetical protein A2269_00780 [Lentisphaerae bacterium RIFOXYA12_FULL_60_10]